MIRGSVFVVILAAPLLGTAEETAIELADRNQPLVDSYLIGALRGASLRLCEPRDEGTVLRFDQPWEGPFCGYCTVIRDGERYRLYYRGKPRAVRDGVGEVTCVAESDDGVRWTKPRLGLVEMEGGRDNNVVLAANDFSHNFSPMLDANPAAAPGQRFKALAGTMTTGLVAFVSADGLRWATLRDVPVIAKAMVPFPYMFDSQNVAFWSPAERKYLAYFRVFQDGIRRICRAESDDFVSWTRVALMEYRALDGGPAPVEHLYINQTAPYFRAPQISVSIAARFMPGRRVLSDEEAKAIAVNPSYFKDTSDAIFMTTRGGSVYDRTFLGSFIRPGIGARNWVSRTNYPALNVVATGPTEMSVYVNQDYAQPTSHLHRYSLRLDGFSSLRAPYEGGEMVTKPLNFRGSRLILNFATSAAGGIRVELQDASGSPLPGFTLGESVETIGNEIARTVRWKGGSDVKSLAGQVVRLRFVMKDADLYAFRFAGE